MSLYAIAEEYLEAGLRLIPLHPVSNGRCMCPDPLCAAAGKHPLRANWQHQRLVDSATLHEVWRESYTCNGLGWALDADHIVIDVDARSGGLKSLEALHVDIGLSLFDACSAIVKTGGGGWHFYFRKDSEQSLSWKLPDKYVGIDVKQAGGFVVIAGSLHSSTRHYEWHSALKSAMEALNPLPEALTLMLLRQRVHKAAGGSNGSKGPNGPIGGTSVEEIADMLSYINPDLAHDAWIKAGMAIHNETHGGMDGLQAWDVWSREGAKYKHGETDKRWHSFGKYVGNNVTIASLVDMAQQAGWVPAMDSDALSPDQLKEIREGWDRKIIERTPLPSIADDADVDLYQPPGLLGQINDYVYACSVFPNRNLALACALSVLTNTIGRRYYWPGKYDNIQPNLLVLCIAGSSVGKDSVLGAAHKLLTRIGLGPAIHGRIKSEKDLLDALTQNQHAIYYNDEFGYFLQRLNNAMKKGNASYLEGVIGTIMEIFTKGDKAALLDVTRKAEIQEKYSKIVETTSKALKDGNFIGDEEVLQEKVKRARLLLDKFKDGLPNPFLSMFTTATPRTMELAFSGEATENGFLSRAMTFHEHETNPRPREDFKGSPDVPMGLAMALQGVAFGRDDCPFGRIDAFDQAREAILIDQDAEVYVQRAADYFLDLAETQKVARLESLPRRALDTLIKICIALAAQERHLTLPMARYAVKLVRFEIDKKIRRVNSTENMESRDHSERLDAIGHRIIEECSTATGATAAVIYKSVKRGRVTLEDVHRIIDEMVAGGYLEVIDTGKTYAGKAILRYRATGK